MSFAADFLNSKYDSKALRPRVVDGWKALRGGSFAVPEPRTLPAPMWLEGFHIGKDLRRYPGPSVLLQGPLRKFVEADALAYNAWACARGLDRWEDDGGR